MGKRIATIGALMLVVGLVFPWSGMLHADLPGLIPPLGYNILQVGGIGLLVLGLVAMRAAGAKESQ